MLWVFGAALVVIGGYLLFRDTMNKIQYIQTLRVYWITRDDGVAGTPLITKAFMKQTAPPWWNGRGIQFRFRTYTFQVGALTHRGSDLLDQLGGRYMNDEARIIREWGKREAQSRSGN